MDQYLAENIELLPVEELIPYINNPKAHPEGQVDKIAASIREFGFLVPLVVEEDGKGIVAGHGRLLAAKRLGLEKVPCIKVSHLTPAQIKAFRIADNKVAESDWDLKNLVIELEGLEEMNFNLEITGFDPDELEAFLDQDLKIEFREYDETIEDEVDWNECPQCGYKWPK